MAATESETNPEILLAPEDVSWQAPPPMAASAAEPDALDPEPEEDGSFPPLVQCQASSQSSVLVISILLALMLGLVSGFLIGERFHLWFPRATPPPAATQAQAPTPKENASDVALEPDHTEAPETGQPPETTPPDATATEPDRSPVTTTHESPEPADPLAAAEAALKAYLEATDGEARARYTLKSDAIGENPPHNPGGPTEYRSVTADPAGITGTEGARQWVFTVVTDTHPNGFPATVHETSDGWKVDSRWFVEARDDLFLKFVNGPTGTSGRFHLSVTTPPAERAARTENEHFSSFLLDAPIPGRQRIAYARKSADFHPFLRQATAEGASLQTVLEITKRTTPDQREYLEITAIGPKP
jgi:hypothetical protein